MRGQYAMEGEEAPKAERHSPFHQSRRSLAGAIEVGAQLSIIGKLAELLPEPRPPPGFEFRVDRTSSRR